MNMTGFDFKNEILERAAYQLCHRCSLHISYTFTWNNVMLPRIMHTTSLEDVTLPCDASQIRLVQLAAWRQHAESISSSGEEIAPQAQAKSTAEKARDARAHRESDGERGKRIGGYDPESDSELPTFIKRPETRTPPADGSGD